MAAGGYFGFWLLTNSAAIFARVMGAKFLLNTSKSSNQVSNLTMLSVVTGPPDCTQLQVDILGLICVEKICRYRRLNCTLVLGENSPEYNTLEKRQYEIWL